MSVSINSLCRLIENVYETIKQKNIVSTSLTSPFMAKKMLQSERTYNRIETRTT